MLPPTKRLNYFDHQFLRRADFVDEQAYHLGMRRAHNRMLHTPGVAQGLKVDVQGNGVVVAEGVAIDAEGRELVVADDVARDLSGVAGSPLWITLVYREEPTDRTSETGAEGDRRWAERGEVGVTDTPPPDDGLTLVLARVVREKGVLSVDDGDGSARRRAASAVGGELDAATLAVRGAARAASLTVTGALSADGARVTTLDASGAVEAGALEVTGGARLGNTTISGTLSAGDATLGKTRVDGDVTVTGSLGVDKDARVAGRVAVGVPAAEAALHLAGGAGSITQTEGDLKIGNASVRLKVGVGINTNPGDARINVMGGANRLFLGSAGVDVVQIANNGVGIGLAPVNPSTLAIAASLHFGVAGAPPAGPDRRLFAPVDGTLRWSAPNTAPSRAFEVGLATGTVPVRLDASGPSYLNGGFLGLGLVAPEAPLHITGGRDVAGTEGDLKIGVGSNRMKMAVVISGPTAGEARIRAEGATPRLILGAAATDVVTVTNGGVSIGAVTQPGTMLNVGGTVNATQYLRNGQPFTTSQWSDVPGGVLIKDRVGIGADPYAELTVNGTLGFANGTAPMFYLQESGTGNPEKMVVAHSPQWGTTGLSYRDADDSFHFRMGLPGTPALSVMLASGRVGVGTDTPSAPLHVKAVDNFVATFESTSSLASGARFVTSEGITNRADFGVRTGGMAYISVGGVNDALTVSRAGVVSVVGNLSCQTLTIRSGAKPGYVFDYFVNRTGEAVEQGDVVVIGGDATEYWAVGSNIPIPEVDLAADAHDRRVCGIVDRVVTGDELPFAEARVESRPKRKGRGKAAEAASDEEAGPHPLERYAGEGGGDHRQVGPGQLGTLVTLGAFAHCKVDADIAPIQVGDLLTTSPTPGHAQKVADPAAAIGAIVGKALGSLESGRGKIPVMVLLQ